MKNLFTKLFARKQETAKKKNKIGAFMMAMAIMALAALPTAVGAAPLSFTGQDIGIEVTDVVSTGFSFMTMFGPYTMLILGVIFAPVAIGFVIWLMRKLPKFGK